ncbi:MAG TPA: FAD-dependent oxidoreductase, partial [Roseovarius nubinhibens]|nr:FAD-dependent oxidoreductase [Roseovarius nubinhibens]
EGPRVKLASLRVDHDRAPAHGGASVMREGKVVGTVSSGDWGHRLGMNIAMAFLKPDLAAEGTTLEIDICGTLVPAEVIVPSPYDPSFSRLRS